MCQSWRKTYFRVPAVDKANGAVVFCGGKSNLFQEASAVLASGVLEFAGAMGTLSERGQYLIGGDTITGAKASVASAPIKGTAALIHCRYPHLSYGSLARLPQMVKGIDAKDVKVDYEAGSICRPCVEGKVTRAPFPPYDSAAGVMEVIHSDVSDPFPLSVGGSRYFVTLYEKKSGVIMATPIARKSDVGMALRTNVPILEHMSSKKCQRIRTDGAKEYKTARLVD